MCLAKMKQVLRGREPCHTMASIGSGSCRTLPEDPRGRTAGLAEARDGTALGEIAATVFAGSSPSQGAFGP